MAALSSVLVIGFIAAQSQPSVANNGTGYYGSWTASGSPGAGSFTTSSQGFPAAAVTSTAGLSSESGASSWLPDWTGIGKEYGSSQNQPYLAVSVPTAGATTTITFSSSTPATGWSFALGDVDAEAVTISAKDASGANVPVRGWFNDTFNYCQNSPRSSGCGTAQTDKPTWNGSNTLTGSGSDTKGASGWFTPNQAIKTLTFTSSKITGLPQYQVWIASDKSVPTVTSPVTIGVASVRGYPPNAKVDLSGTTKATGATVYVYRATSANATAEIVTVTTSSKKSKKWSAKKVSMGRGSTAYFCARVGSKFSNTVRVKSKTKSSKSIAIGRATSPTVRGDIVKCPK